MLRLTFFFSFIFFFQFQFDFNISSYFLKLKKKSLQKLSLDKVYIEIFLLGLRVSTRQKVMTDLGIFM